MPAPSAEQFKVGQISYFLQILLQLSSGDGGGGGTRDALPLSVLIFFIFLQFLAKCLPNNRLEHPLPGLAPPIWGPGSATIVGHLTLQLSAVSIHMLSLRNICRRKISLVSTYVVCERLLMHKQVSG